MDATANEAKGVAIKGFPTLKFYPANNKKPLDFDGDRNFEGMKKFVLEKATAKPSSQTKDPTSETKDAEGRVEL